MNNTDKLLRALIDALGFEIETKVTIQELHNPHDSRVERLPDLIDYKVTKKVDTYEDFNETDLSALKMAADLNDDIKRLKKAFEK